MGEVATRHARRILREHEAGEEQFASVVAGHEGRVRVAASAVFLQGLGCAVLPDTATGIVTRRDHPLQTRVPSWEELAGYPWIVFGPSPDHEGGNLLDDFRRHAGRPAQCVVRCGPDGLHLMQAGNSASPQTPSNGPWIRSLRPQYLTGANPILRTKAIY